MSSNMSHAYNSVHDEEDEQKDCNKNTNSQIVDLDTKIAYHTTSQRIDAAYNITPYKKERLSISDHEHEQLDVAIKQHQHWNSFFQPKVMPNSGDWLQAFPQEQRGQSFNAWYKILRKGKSCKIHSLLSNPHKHNIGLITVGSFDMYLTKSLHSLFDILSEITSTFYFGTNIRILDSIPTSNIKSRHNSRSQTKQLKTGSICKQLKAIKKQNVDLCCVMGVSIIDLYPGEKWNFVFGEASCYDAVGIFSFARYLPGFSDLSNIKHTKNVSVERRNKLMQLKSMLNGKQTRHDPKWFNQILSEKEQILFIKRCVQVLTHEIGHLFGLDHCPYFECVMNGANHLVESDAQPVHLCPICLHKLYFVSLLMQKSECKIKAPPKKKHNSTRSMEKEPERQHLDILTRYQRLRELFSKYGMAEESEWYRKRAQFVFQSLTKLNSKQKLL
eukprot:12772_1